MLFNPDDVVKNVSDYFKKLKFILDNEAKLKFGNIRIVDKTKVDDILCCVEASVPKEFAKAVSLRPAKYLAPKKYKSLVSTIKRKVLFSNNLYAVKYSDACKSIQFYINDFTRELKIFIRDDA